MHVVLAVVANLISTTHTSLSATNPSYPDCDRNTAKHVINFMSSGNNDFPNFF